MRFIWLLSCFLLFSVLSLEAQGMSNIYLNDKGKGKSRTSRGLRFMREKGEGIRTISKEIVSNNCRRNIHEIVASEIINKDSVEDVKLGKGQQYSGRIRKLITSPNSSSTTMAKSAKNKAQSKSKDSPTNKSRERKEENMYVNATYVTGQPQDVRGTNPDMVDLAGMDYSLASRKPHIHN